MKAEHRSAQPEPYYSGPLTRPLWAISVGRQSHQHSSPKTEKQPL